MLKAADPPAVRRLLAHATDIDVNECDIDRKTRLWIACEAGDEPMVRALIGAPGVSVTQAQGSTGFTPLHIACEQGHTDVVRALLEVVPRADTLDYKTRTPLKLACASARPRIEIVELLLARVPPPGAPELGAAITAGNPEIVRLLLRVGAPPNTPLVHGGQTPLLAAVRGGKTEIAAALLEAGADPFARGNALQEAAGLGMLDALRLIVEAQRAASAPTTAAGRASEWVKQGLGLRLQRDGLDSLDANGKTPLLVAAAAGAAPTLELLLELGADPNLASPRKAHTPLLVAVQAHSGALAMARALLARGADPNVGTSSGRCVLACAIMRPRTLPDTVEIVDLLLQHGADVNRASESSHTPLMRAVLERDDNVDVVGRLLQQPGIELDTKTQPQGKTAMAFCARWDRPRHLEALVRAGADVEAADSEGATPLVIAASRSDWEMSSFLLDEGASTELDAALIDDRDINGYRYDLLRAWQQWTRKRGLLVWLLLSSPRRLFLPQHLVRAVAEFM